jgi:transcriptional regulator with XRE-family HTH domain
MTTVVTMELASYLKRELAQRGWSEREAARRMEMSYRSLNAIIKDPERLPELDTLGRIAKGLGVPLRRLIEACGFGIENHNQDAQPAPIRRLTDEDRAFIDAMTVEELEEFIDFVRAQRRRLRGG